MRVVASVRMAMIVMVVVIHIRVMVVVIVVIIVIGVMIVVIIVIGVMIVVIIVIGVMIVVIGVMVIVIIVIGVMVIVIIVIHIRVMVVMVVVIGVMVVVIGVMVVVIGVMVVVIIVFISVTTERNQIGMFRDPQHRRTRSLDRRERVLQLKLQKQSIGHHKVRILHAFPVTQRRFESVSVAADRNDGLNVGNSTTGQVGNDVCPDSGSRLDIGDVSLGVRRRFWIGGVPTSSSNQRQRREDNCRSQQVPTRLKRSSVFG